MKITQKTYEEILMKLDATRQETGGILGEKEGVVCRFFLDGAGTRGEYRPNVALLNQAIEAWAEEGVSFIGLVHTHINGLGILSPNDIDYARLILSANELEYVYFPVVAKDKDGKKIMRSYRITQNDVVEEQNEITN